MYNDVIKLVNKTATTRKDIYGDVIYTETYSEIFAEVVSVGRNEFYQAMTAGFKPEITFKIADYYDYNNQEELIHENTRYKILRTYMKGTELEIVCYGGVHERTEVSN